MSVQHEDLVQAGETVKRALDALDQEVARVLSGEAPDRPLDEMVRLVEQMVRSFADMVAAARAARQREVVA